MDWLSKTWIEEDEIFAPKRKVNNRGSQWYPHIIGSFYSYINGRPVGYESLNERMFYAYLELDREVVRYYVQPIQVLVSTGGKEWHHVPDTLVFRQWSRPLLYQIKESEEDIQDEVTQICNKECELIAKMYSWDYRVIYPKTLPAPLPHNINFLNGYLRTCNYYSEWADKVILRLSYIGPCSVEVLSQSFMDVIDPLHIKPLVYHLIAHGYFLIDVLKTIGSQSIITVNFEMKSALSIKEDFKGELF
ncbi:hypothetical protein PASE110613_16840 [Paenibacillus sediminis]|uniref:TnsA endonuclease N-terminal domain-containing protein n=1 Tax=Paenibacillus sediminis TaxID=664909 RepID=A0ABS4H7R2_9BACL|nr:hypothetical protein [Paenibacillus sediminis]MBP1938566.1 hypothetical protein [Paenibacillus sediminis]